MSKQANTAAIGAFVLGAVAILLVAIALLGSGKLFKDSVTYVAVFDSSVKGLNVGAPVQFRGVPMGSVSRIAIDRRTQTGTRESILIPVFLDISPDYSNIDDGGSRSTKELRKTIAELIDQGLRARLTQQSFVTGMLEIELIMVPDSEPVLTGAVKDVPEIPVIPTSLELIKTEVQNILEQLKKVPFAELVKDIQESVAAVRDLAASPDLKNSITNLNKLLGDPALQRSARDLDQLLVNSNRLVTTLNDESGPMLQEFSQAASSVSQAASSAEETLAKIATNIDQDSALYYEINQTLDQLGEAAQSLRTLTDYLNQHPEALLRGKQPE